MHTITMNISTDFDECGIKFGSEAELFGVFYEKVAPVAFYVGHFQVVPHKVATSSGYF